MYKALTLLTAAYLVLPCVALSETLCTGYDAAQGSWGPKQVSAAVQEAYCPAGTAFVAHQIATRIGSKKRRHLLPPTGSCCPLPNNALTNEHTFAEAACPDDHVITGGRIAPDSVSIKWENESSIHYQLRCTRINTKEYTLGPAAETLIVAASEYVDEQLLRTFGRNKVARTSYNFIPPFLRYGIGRETRTTWLEKLCVGYPWGAPLIELGQHGCAGFVFRPLIPRAGPADDGKTCRAVADIYSEHAHCLP